MVFEWKGVFPAIITPFLADDRLDLNLFELNLRTQYKAGIHGVVIGVRWVKRAPFLRMKKNYW